MKARLELFEWFTIRHRGTNQQFLLTEAGGDFRLFIDGSGLPIHYDHPGPVDDVDKAVLPRHLRVRPGFVIHAKVKIGHKIGYDLSTNTVVAYGIHHRLCWRSNPITNIAVIAEI